MKFSLPLCCLLSLGSALCAQQSMVSGTVTYFNSKRETGQLRYVQNAEVVHAAPTPKAQQNLTDGDGVFRLTFVGIPEKETVVLQVSKPDEDLEVVNPDALECIAGQKTPVKIWMADRRKLAQAQLQFQNNAATAAYNALDNKLRQKEAELKKLQAQASAGTQQLAELKAEIALLKSQFDKIGELASQLAQRYARINLDEMPPLYADAYQYFERGELDSALQVLSRGNLAGQARQVLEERDRIGNLRSEADARDSLQREKTWDLIEAYKLKLDLHKNRFEFDSLETCYKTILLLDSTDYRTTTRYADYLAERFQNTKAIALYEQALRLVISQRDRLVILGNLAAAYHQRNDYAKVETNYLEVLAIYRERHDNAGISVTLHNLGNLYYDTKRYTQAEAALKECINIRESTIKYRPDDEEAHAFLAGSYNILANIYEARRNYPLAAANYRLCLAQQQTLLEKSPQLHLAPLANTLNNLGVLYRDKNQYDSSEYYLRLSLDTLLSLTKTNASLGQRNIALVWNNLGVLYINMRKYSEAENALQNALKIRQNLALAEPESFNPGVSECLENLGDLYRKQKKYAKAREVYQQSLRLRKQMAESGIAVFEAAVGDVYNDLALAFKEQKDYARADSAYLQAQAVYQSVADGHAELFYQENVARIQNNRGGLYLAQKNYPAAEAAYLQALDIRKRLAATEPVYESNLATTLDDLAGLYRQQKDYRRAAQYYVEAIEYLRKLALAEPGIYEPRLANSYSDLALVYNDTKVYNKSEAFYTEALALRKRLAQTDPETHHPEVARICNNLGLLYTDMAEFARAEASFREAIALRTQLAEKDPVAYDPLRSASYRNLGDLFGNQNNYVEAEIAYLQAFGILEKIPGPDKSELASVCGNLAWYQLFLKKFTDAENSARKGLQYNPQALWIATNLAHALLFQGKYAEAEKVYVDLKDRSYDQDPSRKFGGIFLEDLKTLEAAGVTHPDVVKIQGVLNR